MTLTQYHIKIEHEKFGSLMKETFVDPIQFRLFLKMILESLGKKIQIHDESHSLVMLFAH